MYFDNIPTIPTADELLDRSFRRAAKKMREKNNKNHANEDFVRAITQATHDKLVSIIQSFPEFEQLPPFYRDLCDILFGMDNLRQALGMVGWAAKNVRDVGKGISRGMRRADTLTERKRAVARIASIVHRADDALRYLNDVRNVLRKLPVISTDEFTIVVAGYPNVGKSSFIRLVSSAEPEIASYPFTTKGVIVGHRNAERRKRIQFIDTPGLLDRSDEERNAIEKQALNALVYVADLVLFVIDASEHCGYSVEAQEKLREEIAEIVAVPMLTVVNKADIKKTEDRFNMSTITGEGVEDVLAELLRQRTKLMQDEVVDIRSELPVPEMKRRGGRTETKTEY
ncbi:50S ribosome-binding GTPase [Methanocorpusculum sp. MG]|uniref:50S ribosome-binding GTPase n=1 Tax=Methanocorpusculum petauri TaxID=3002863 RepID=A0ABT4IDT6_9EURY|nr:GTPase [Methanocorpusculum petauri]MCZ0859898.1 50S ribosome-binding GTPase [Methanocorpusculum petauri]MDE2443735.1 50S ribosome-binding GTPase [Methanocorpusculum sp.]